MRKKLGLIIILSALAIGNPAFAISNQSQNALNAFRRYEPEFSSTLRRLEELNKKLSGLKDDKNLTKTSEIWLKAEELMGKVEERYDSLEDIYNSALSMNPGDRIELNEGFSRLDDIYRDVRDFYTDNYTYGGEKQSKKGDSEPASHKDSELSVAQAKSKDKLPYEITPLAAEDYKLILAQDQEVRGGRSRHGLFQVKGNIKFSYKDGEEKHQSIGKSGVTPNDQTTGQLLLTYDFNENRKLSLEEKYLKRERNEKIKENHLTLSFFNRLSDTTAYTLKDKLQHVWYTNDASKDYRINLFEAIYSKTTDSRDRTAKVGVKTKKYKHNSTSNYNQYIISDDESWYRRNTTAFASIKGEFTKYKEANRLNYNNYSLYTELNRSYTGNKAEMKVANTFDRRLYNNESTIAFRTSYFDDLFQFNYELPVNDKVDYTFDGQYSKRKYASDYLRGYAQLEVFNGVVIKTDKRTYVVGDHRYTYNDENTRMSAHKNNVYHIGWRRNVNKDYTIKLDNSFHKRKSMENLALDFKQNKFTADLSWRIKKDYKLSWVSEHFNRRYENISIGVSDYRYLESGVNFSFMKRKSHDWRLAQKWRKMEFRNLIGLPTPWESHVLPTTEFRYNHWIKSDIKFSVRATYEKTYYRVFNSDSQELEFDFGDPVFNKELFASLEYYF